VVESKELLDGQKRGIAARLVKATVELERLERLVQTGRIRRASLEQRVKKTLGREHLSSFVVAEIGGSEKKPTFRHPDLRDSRTRPTRRRGVVTFQGNWCARR
jgi:hypothetical protein